MKLFKRNNTDIKKIITAIWDFWTSKTGAFLLAVSAIVIGWYQFYINRPILKYEAEVVSVISSSNENNYKVTVNNTEYKDLHLTKVILQNKGAAALSGNDVSKIGHNPIRVVIPEGSKVVHYTLDNTITTPDITSKLQEVDGDLIINFDFLNPDYQIAVAILHENPNAKFEVFGSALNVNSISREWTDKQVKYWTWWGVGIMWVILLTFYIYNHWLKQLIRRDEKAKR